MWAKCDMLATVGFDRLHKPYFRVRSGRRYVELVLDAEDMASIDTSLQFYLSL